MYKVTHSKDDRGPCRFRVRVTNLPQTPHLSRLTRPERMEIAESVVTRSVTDSKSPNVRY